MENKKKKRRLILFPGQLDGVFMKNELGILSESFDRVTAISSRGDKKSFLQIQKKYGIQCEIVKNVSVLSLIKSVCMVFTDQEIKEEMKRVMKVRNSLSLNLKRILYMFFYINYAVCAEKIYKSLQDDRFDDTLYSFWLSRTAFACACIRRKYPVQLSVSRAHGYDLYEKRNETGYLPFRQYISRYTDRISFISENGKSYFVDRYIAYRCRLSVCCLGTWNPAGVRKRITNKNYICIVSCSSITQVKRLDRIIDVLSVIRLPLRWIHIGEGSLRKQTEDYAKVKMKKHFWFSGFVDNENILNFYKENDVDFLINMSDSEGLPVSMMEALSFGIPLIAGNVGGVSEIVDSDTGLLVESPTDTNAIEEISLQIEQFIRMRLVDVELYKRMSACCVKKWQEKFHAGTNYQYFVQHVLS